MRGMRLIICTDLLSQVRLATEYLIIVRLRTSREGTPTTAWTLSSVAPEPTRLLMMSRPLPSVGAFHASRERFRRLSLIRPTSLIGVPEVELEFSALFTFDTGRSLKRASKKNKCE